MNWEVKTYCVSVAELYYLVIELGSSDNRTGVGKDCPMGIGCRRSEQDADVDARVIPKSPWDMNKL